MNELREIVENMAPEEALAVIADAARGLLVHLDDRARADFVIRMIGEAGADRVASLADL